MGRSRPRGMQVWAETEHMHALWLCRCVCVLWSEVRVAFKSFGGFVRLEARRDMDKGS